MSKIGHNSPPLSEGWIARHRSVRDHWLVGHGIHVKPADPDRKRCHTQGEAWEDLLMECRYADATVSNGGKKMQLHRGELIGAVSWLATRWNWTPKTVRRFLDQLENDGMIELKNPASEKGNQIGRQANVVTVCNYDEYQLGIMPERQPKGQPQGDQRATTGRPEGNIYKEEQRNKGTKEQERGVTNVTLRVGVPDELRAFYAYNEMAQILGFPMASALTPARRRTIAARLREHGGFEAWEKVRANVERSSFLQGGGDKGWRIPGFDWLFGPKNFLKVLEGSYGNGAHAKPKESEWERMDRLMGVPSRSTDDIEIIPPARRP